MTETSEAILVLVAGVSDSPDLFNFFKAVVDATETLVGVARTEAKAEECERCANIADTVSRGCQVVMIAAGVSESDRADATSKKRAADIISELIRKDRGCGPSKVKS